MKEAFEWRFLSLLKNLQMAVTFDSLGAWGKSGRRFRPWECMFSKHEGWCECVHAFCGWLPGLSTPSPQLWLPLKHNLQLYLHPAKAGMIPECLDLSFTPLAEPLLETSPFPCPLHSPHCASESCLSASSQWNFWIKKYCEFSRGPAPVIIIFFKFVCFHKALSLLEALSYTVFHLDKATEGV